MSRRRWAPALDVAAVVSLGSLGSASAAGGPFGLGIAFGDPSGLTAKLFMDKRHALQFGLDFSFLDDSFYASTDYLLHFPGAWGNPSGGKHEWSPYLGIGGKVAIHDRGRRDDERRGRIGVRVPLGIAFMPKPVPMDVFLEIVPQVGILPEVKSGIGGALGVRYYF